MPDPPRDEDASQVFWNSGELCNRAQAPHSAQVGTKLIGHPRIMTSPLDVIATLEQLIRIPSVNPMGRDVAGAPYLEYQVTDFLQQFFEQLGVPWHRQPVAPLRDNIVACLEGHGDASTIVFEVHQDTVPVEGMTIAPWEPVIRDGRLYGRGACDDKGPMACMLTAFARLAQQEPHVRPTIVMACTVNEEHGFTGARELARSWSAGEHPLVTRLPDAMVVAEPTSLDVVVAHKGVVRWRSHTKGRAAHSSQPEQGENAIYTMGQIITLYQQYADSLSDQPSHQLLGQPTLNVGTIQGGICVNAVPDQCTIEIDRRLLPHEDPHEARQAAIDWLAQRLPKHISDRVQHDTPFLTSYGLSEQTTDGLASRVQQVAHATGAHCDRIGVPYATDAPCFARLGIPTVVFGPGSIQQAHTADEWVPLNELHLAVEAYLALATEGLRAC